jgi:hypothetical protein
MRASGTGLLEEEEAAAAAMPKRQKTAVVMMEAGRTWRGARTMIELDAVVSLYMAAALFLRSSRAKVVREAQCVLLGLVLESKPASGSRGTST